MNMKKYFPWVLLIAVTIGLAIFMMEGQGKKAVADVNFTDFIAQVDRNNVHDVIISGSHVVGHFRDSNRVFTTTIAGISSLLPRLEEHNVNIEIKGEGEDSFWTTLFLNAFPMFIFIAVWIYFARRGTGGPGGISAFGKSKAKLLTEATGTKTFEDVAGVDEAKEDLQEVVEFLQDPGKFERLGGRIPKGVLLVGPPGTGKTLLARAVAGEAGVPFFSISGSDFVEMFVGVGASRVRDMFEQAKKNAPCIIFIDEIDAVGRSRANGISGNDERDQTLNAMLVEMDGFNDNEGIIVIAATNRVDVLDAALTRPGRFDRQIQVPNPDFVGREKILKVHSRKVPIGPDVNLKTVAKGTPGFSGADLANLVNEAALLAARRSKRIVTAKEFEDARDKILMGAERRTLLMTEEEKSMTAYHEAGHALVSMRMPASTPIHKATIIPRGRALGMVQSLPERDRISMHYEEMIAQLAMAMGGRVAEELIFGKDKVSSGASGDIQQATQLARAMVTEYGFSSKLGRMAYTTPNADMFHTPKISEKTQETVDKEVLKLVEEGYDTAKKILTDEKKHLDTIAKSLIEYETLSGNELKDLLEGKKPTRDY
jgi:cell division protease FtsH